MSAVPWGASVVWREVMRIAGLARQNAIAFGGSLQMPVLIRAPTADPLPRSEDAKFDQWNAEIAEEVDVEPWE